jgi:hypothetical protein
MPARARGDASPPRLQPDGIDRDIDDGDWAE